MEGPARDKSYRAYVEEVLDFWFTQADDPEVGSPVQRVRHYRLWPDCQPRVRAWRAKATNIRDFNHNPCVGACYPVKFNLRHYPMRTMDPMMRRIERDRADIQRGGANYHYNNMSVLRGSVRTSVQNQAA